MDLGVALPTSGPYASVETIVRVAQEAERLGYGAVWTYERLLFPTAGATSGGSPLPLPDYYASTYEPLETLSYVAAWTSRVRLGTSVVNAVFHNPVVLARRFATLDRLSGGRAIAGLGLGWMDQEYEAVGVSRRTRGEALEEAITALRAAWGPDPVGFHGKHYTIPSSAINPKPVQRPGVPVVLAATTPAAIDRAARLADGLNPIGFSYESLAEAIARFRASAADAGRDAADLQVIVRANTPLTAEDLDGSRPFLAGSARQVAADLDRLAPLEVDHVLFADMASTTVEDGLRRLAELREAASAVEWGDPA
ncbi:TIGR03619 family F420-dependent LLM class oxidoreductase [Thermoactinospora rubra]|uniref:TIGR03619 family F420-dependent LLM class oxidoreductase n=1 Tax=Thermoactinospora rubra TaxID=1088767 RepID=UPI000A0F99BB|nr:TIGR03619 family F420-dependent LLM class oxidoreductase [Thermoactinospora rubra]